MHWVLTAAAFGYAVVDVFGAWTVVRRRPRLSFLFMVAAAVLTVGGVGAVYRVPETWIFFAAGAGASSIASYLNARLILARVTIINHLARLVAGVALAAAAWLLLA